MATAKRARTTSSTTRSKKVSASIAAPEGPVLTKGNGNVEEEIRVRAYQLFEQRGRTHGFDMEDWLRAETELSSLRRSA
ncbi:MAG TPA: DUF2934 domain-containing protein [Terriglobales bacterium]|nr:DUF2934 domain-containing protein [Terriglobales bacterium]